MAPTGDHYALRFSLTPILTSSDRRSIVVRPGEPVLIGRASHSLNKSLRESPSNALFDCSVISRAHAIIEAHPWASSSEQIKITDRSSTHGTYVNGIRIMPGVPMPLKSGDHIRLGRPIARETAYPTNEGYRALSHGFHVSVPSDVSDAGLSDSEASSYCSEDDDVKNPSSAHTTPDKRKAALGSQQKPIDLAGEHVADEQSVVAISEDESLMVAPSKNPQMSSRLSPDDVVVLETQKFGFSIISDKDPRVAMLTPTTNGSAINPVTMAEEREKDDHVSNRSTPDPVVPDSLSKPLVAYEGDQESSSEGDDDVAEEDVPGEKAEEKLEEEVIEAVATASATETAAMMLAANEDGDSDVGPEIMSSKGPQASHRSIDGAPSQPTGIDMAASHVFPSYPLYPNTAMTSDQQTALPTMSFPQEAWRSIPYGSSRSRYDPVRGSPAPSDFYNPFNPSSSWYHEPSYVSHEPLIPVIYSTEHTAANTVPLKFPTSAPYHMVQPTASQDAYQPLNATQSSQPHRVVYVSDGVDDTISIFGEQSLKDDYQERPVIKKRLSISNLVNAKSPAAAVNNQPETSDFMAVIAENSHSPSARSSPLVPLSLIPMAGDANPGRKRTFDEMEAAIEPFDAPLRTEANEEPTQQNCRPAPSSVLPDEQQRQTISMGPRKKKAKQSPTKGTSHVRRVLTNVTYLALGVVGTHLFYESSLSEKLINLLS